MMWIIHSDCSYIPINLYADKPLKMGSTIHHSFISARFSITHNIIQWSRKQLHVAGATNTSCGCGFGY